MKKIDYRTAWVGYMEQIILITIVGFLFVLINVPNEIVQINEKANWIVGIVGVILLLKGIASSYLYAKKTRYELTEEHILLYDGSFAMREMIVPKRRIQHITTQQDVFSRIFNLYTVEVYTAGNPMTIEYVGEEEAMRLKGEVTEYLREGKGLTDDATT